MALAFQHCPGKFLFTFFVIVFIKLVSNSKMHRQTPFPQPLGYIVYYSVVDAGNFVINELKWKIKTIRG